jgi:hypothetical protein
MSEHIADNANKAIAVYMKKKVFAPKITMRKIFLRKQG